MKTIEYITIENNIVTGHFCGPEPKAKDGITVIEVHGWCGLTGTPLDWFFDVKTGAIKPLATRIEESIEKIPEGKKLSKDKTYLEDMSEEEKIIAGVIPLDPKLKIVNEHLESKTQKELYDDGLISSKEYNAYIDMMRKSAYSQESDPLYMQVVRGDVTEAQWLLKIEEIKERHPKVTEDTDEK